MKLIMLNTYDSRGGAAIATYRLHRGLRSIGVGSQLMVMIKFTDDPAVIGPEPRTRLKRTPWIAPCIILRQVLFCNSCSRENWALVLKLFHSANDC